MPTVGFFLITQPSEVLLFIVPKHVYKFIDSRGVIALIILYRIKMHLLFLLAVSYLFLTDNLSLYVLSN